MVRLWQVNEKTRETERGKGEKPEKDQKLPKPKQI